MSTLANGSSMLTGGNLLVTQNTVQKESQGWHSLGLCIVQKQLMTALKVDTAKQLI